MIHKKRINQMKEFDIVELINITPKYEKYGLKIGDVGVIMDPECIYNFWDVVFSEYHTCEDIAEIGVSKEDLQVLEKMPEQKFQPNDTVKLINFCPEYKQYNIKIGDIGTVYHDKIISTSVYVKFPNHDRAIIFKKDLQKIKLT